MVQALTYDCSSEIAFPILWCVSAYAFQSSQLITSVLFILGMEQLQWVLPYLLEPMGDCSVVSKSIRKASFQMWISQAIDQALRSVSQTDASYNSFQSVLRGTMTTHSAAMCYVWFQEFSRSSSPEKMATNRAMRDIIIRCIIRDADDRPVPVDLLSKIQELFGDYATSHKDIFSQLKNSFYFNCRQQRNFVPEVCVFVLNGECACGGCAQYLDS